MSTTANFSRDVEDFRAAADGPDPDPDVEAARQTWLEAELDHNEANVHNAWATEQVAAGAWCAYEDAWNDRHGPDAQAGLAGSITDPEPEIGL